jgi:hypothetical protein
VPPNFNTIIARLVSAIPARVDSDKQKSGAFPPPPADPFQLRATRQSRPPGPAGTVILVISVMEITVAAVMPVGRANSLTSRTIAGIGEARKTESGSREVGKNEASGAERPSS